MGGSQPHQHKATFFCRECGDLYCEECNCSCFTCKCPCHGGEAMVHDE